MKLSLYILGTTQDGGYPHPGCTESCCKAVINRERFASSIAIVDELNKQYWLIDITPDYKEQIHFISSFNCTLKGVFITHAHIGHYIGLTNFGLEIMNLNRIPIYLMPQMRNFVQNNDMLNQLILNNNIEIHNLSNNKPISINPTFEVIPFEVPHRNELSETVGFKIKGVKESAIYIPDIDTWDNWEEKLIELVYSNNILFIDGTFYVKEEIKNRDVSKIPHPEITETMKLLSDLDCDIKKRVYFTHLNHTNDVLRKYTSSYKEVINSGFNVAEEQQKFSIS